MKNSKKEPDIEVARQTEQKGGGKGDYFGLGLTITLTSIVSSVDLDCPLGFN